VERLTDAFVSVNARISRCACEVFTIPVGNMLTVGTLVALGKTKVNYEYAILRLLAAADEEVVGFDVSVDDALLVHFLDALDLHKSDSFLPVKWLSATLF